MTLRIERDGSGTGYVRLDQTALTVNGAVGGSGDLRFETPASSTLTVNGTLAPAALGTTGALSVAGNVVLGAGSQSKFDVGMAGRDRLNVTGNLTLGGTLAVTAIGSLTPSTNVIMTYSGTRSGSMVVMPTVVGGQVLSLITNVPGQVRLATVDLPATPVIETWDPTNVLAYTATLVGYLSSTGDYQTTVFAYWGASDCGTNGGPTKWAHTNIVGIRNVGRVTSGASDLTAGGTYHYRFAATNQDGRAWAQSSESFTTISNAAVYSTGALAQWGKAQLRGVLSNETAKVYVCWGDNNPAGASTAAWDRVVYVGNLGAKSSFGTTVTGLIYGVTYYYRCFATNAASGVWSAAASFNGVRPAVNYANGLRGSIFQSTPDTQTPMDLVGGTYNISLTRVYTGDKANTVLALAEDPLRNVVATGEILNWNNFPGFTPGEHFVTAFSGIICPRTSGNHTFRWSNDDRGWMWVDMDLDGTFESGENVGSYGWDGTGSKTLASGMVYPFMYFAQEHGGGQSLNFWVTEPGSGEARVNTITQAPLWQYPTGVSRVGITNTSATAIAWNAATVRGTVFAPMTRYAVYAHWGATNGTNNASAWAHSAYVGAYTNLASVSVSNRVTGLSEHTTYWYTFRASNAAEQVWARPSTNFMTQWRPRELEVVSAHGTAIPAVGVYSNAYGASVTCRVSRVESHGVTTQYVCTGWTMTGGQTPASGVTTNFTMTHTNDTTLTWLWSTNYWLATATNGPGTVNVPSGWTNRGASVTITATANAHHHFTGWSGQTSGCTILTGPDRIVAPMTQARAITAQFAIDTFTVTVGSDYGTPTPSVGPHVYDYGTVLNPSVAGSPVVQALATQRVCTGWVMSGHAPSGGAATNFPSAMVVTNTATLTWTWKTQHWLDLTAGANGSVGPADQWVDAGGAVQAAATPAGGFRFDRWTGDTGAIESGGVNATNITVRVNAPVSLTATFTVTRAGALFLIR